VRRNKPGAKRKIPIPGAIISSRRDKTTRNKKRKKNKKRTLGKDISVTQSASPGQVIYGLTKTGGVYTFIETNADSKAYVVVGENNRQVAFQCRDGGTIGNTTTIELTVSGTIGTNTVTVVGRAISVRLKSSGGSSTCTADQLIASIRASAAADALVSCNRGTGDGTGTMLAATAVNFVDGGGTWLHQYLTLACHEINSVEALYLDERLVTLGASNDPRWGTGIWEGRCFMHVQYGSDSQTVAEALKGNLPARWTDNHRQRGCAGVYLVTVWNQNVFADGFPEATFLIKGKKVYDPRTGQTAWTDSFGNPIGQNAALIIADYLTNTKFGMGIPYAEIDEPTLIEAANICDEVITFSWGGSERRYTIQGYFDADSPPAEILNEMAQAIAGDIVYQNGKWYIYPAKWRAPSLTLTDDMLVGPMQITTKVSRSDSFNSVRGTFNAPNNNYNESDYPVVTSALYVTEDGGNQVFEDISFELTHALWQCHRVAKIELERVRQGITVLYPMGIEGLQLQVCDTVYLTSVRMGWAVKTFEVRDISIEEDVGGTISVVLLLRETASGVFDWVEGSFTETDLSPNTTLPSPYDVQAVSGLTLTSGTSELYLRIDGTVFSRLRVSWAATTDIYVLESGNFEIQHKRSSEITFSHSAYVSGAETFFHILDVEDGVAYDVQVRAINSIGSTSAWAQVLSHTVLGKLAPPTNTSGFTANASDLGIQMTWAPVTDIDLSAYEIRYGSDWNSGTVLVSLLSGYTAYVWPQLAAGTYRLMLKAKDTSGNYSVTESLQVVVIQNPNPVSSLTGRSLGNFVLIDWQDSPQTTLSVNQFEIYKGDSFAASVRVGVSFGTFLTYIESSGGTFKYWVVAVDVGGNRSTETSIQITVQPLSNFYVQDDINPFADGTLVDSKFLVVGGSADAPSEPQGELYFPIGRAVLGTPDILPVAWEDEIQTWEEWFDDAGFATLQDFIDAGYDIPMSPNPYWPGFVEFEYDFGVTLPNTIINFTWETEVFQENDTSVLTIVPTISTSPDDVTYTPYVNVSQLFASNFRYARFRLDFEASDDVIFARISAARALLQVQEDEETGVAAVLAADAGGTVVTFTKDFLYITSIQCTPQGTTFGAAVYDFAGGLDPASFNILLFDAAGNRINGNVSWTIKGPLNPT
jgi:hypothetical protein